MGQEKKTLSGFSSKATITNAGLLYHSDVVQVAPPYLRPKALKIFAYKVRKRRSAASYISVGHTDQPFLLRGLCHPSYALVVVCSVDRIFLGVFDSCASSWRGVFS